MSRERQELMLTLLILHGPHHEVHTGGVCLAAELEGAQLTVDPVCIVQNLLKLRLAGVELLQHKIMDLLHKGGREVCRREWAWQLETKLRHQNSGSSCELLPSSPL